MDKFCWRHATALECLEKWYGCGRDAKGVSQRRVKQASQLLQGVLNRGSKGAPMVVGRAQHISREKRKILLHIFFKKCQISQKFH